MLWLTHMVYIFQTGSHGQHLEMEKVHIKIGFSWEIWRSGNPGPHSCCRKPAGADFIPLDRARALQVNNTFLTMFTPGPDAGVPRALLFLSLVASLPTPQSLWSCIWVFIQLWTLFRAWLRQARGARQLKYYLRSTTNPQTTAGWSWHVSVPAPGPPMNSWRATLTLGFEFSYLW
jgi:hypothetical protein